MSDTIPFSLKEPKLLSQHKEFFFDEYNYYFNEREKLKQEIIFALNDKTVSHTIKNGFRLTSTKYATHPLSSKRLHRKRHRWALQYRKNQGRSFPRFSCSLSWK